MTSTPAETRAVIVERDFPHPPDKVWRALTQPHLIAEWLMSNDFRPEPGHRFTLAADWGSVACEVRTVEPCRTLSYSWDTKDLRSIVTWTLTAIASGTRLRIEQQGFTADQRSYFQGATAGWPRFLARMDDVLARDA